MAQSGLERLPVTEKIEGSNPSSLAMIKKAIFVILIQLIVLVGVIVLSSCSLSVNGPQYVKVHGKDCITFTKGQVDKAPPGLYCKDDE